MGWFQSCDQVAAQGGDKLAHMSGRPAQHSQRLGLPAVGHEGLLGGQLAAPSSTRGLKKGKSISTLV